jgi:UDP-N-acetylmuramoyl-L-alanyl-D-glutamate--2,6-diaminopimelate ligase
LKNIDTLIYSEEIRKSTIPVMSPLVSGLAVDSSEVKAGDLFFAISGTKKDGHSFIAEALKKGACGVVVERLQNNETIPAILVDNTRKALALAAARWHSYPSKDFDLIGVTGTNGKTTTTYLLRDVFRELGLTAGVVGTVQNQVGQVSHESKLTTPGPLELQNLFAQMRDTGVTHAAMEVTSIALDQYRTLGSHFRAAIFTNLTQDHLDYHRDFQTYYEAKLRLFRDYGIEVAVINGDDAWGERLWSDCTAKKKVRVGLSGRASDTFEYEISNVNVTRTGMRGSLKTPKWHFDFRTPLFGEHNLYNCLGVIAVSSELGLSMDLVLSAIGRSKGAPGRLEPVAEGEDKPTVLVDYAHTTDALVNVLRSLKGLRVSGRLITVFGCGGDRDRVKRPQMGKAASEWSDVTIATSDNPRTEDPNAILDEIEKGVCCDKTVYHREVDRRKAIQLALNIAEPQDVVLIAGKGHENYQILGTERIHFDDAEEVRSFFDAMRCDKELFSLRAWRKFWFVLIFLGFQ